jgi:hypothetical protein
MAIAALLCIGRPEPSVSAPRSGSALERMSVYLFERPLGTHKPPSLSAPLDLRLGRRRTLASKKNWTRGWNWRRTPTRQEWIARVEGGARAYQAFAEQAYETFQDQGRQRRADQASLTSQGSYLSVPTLRRHDVFVTATGFHVFKGSTHFPYLQSDFVHFSEAEGKALFLSSAARP